MEEKDKKLLERKSQLLESQLNITNENIERMKVLDLFNGNDIEALRTITGPKNKAKLLVNMLKKSNKSETMIKLCDCLRQHYTTARLGDEIDLELQMAQGKFKPASYIVEDCSFLVHRTYGAQKRLSEIEKKTVTAMCSERTEIQNRLWETEVKRLMQLIIEQRAKAAQKKKRIQDLTEVIKNFLEINKGRVGRTEDSLFGLTNVNRVRVLQPGEENDPISDINGQIQQLVNLTSGSLLETESILKERTQTFKVLDQMMDLQKRGEHISESKAVKKLNQGINDDEYTYLDVAEKNALNEIEVRRQNNEMVIHSYDRARIENKAQMDRHRITHDKEMHRLNMLEQTVRKELDVSLNKMLEWGDKRAEVNRDWKYTMGELEAWKARVEELESGKMIGRIYEKKKQQTQPPPAKPVRKDKYANMPRFKLPDISTPTGSEDFPNEGVHENGTTSSRASTSSSGKNGDKGGTRESPRSLGSSADFNGYSPRGDKR